MIALIGTITALILAFFIGALMLGSYLRKDEGFIKWNKCPDCGRWDDVECNCRENDKG